jgi:hypothetical protein
LRVAPNLRLFHCAELDMDEPSHHADGADTLSDLILAIPFAIALNHYLAGVYIGRRRGRGAIDLKAA